MLCFLSLTSLAGLDKISRVYLNGACVNFLVLSLRFHLAKIGLKLLTVIIANKN